MLLTALLRRFLKPYRWWLTAVILFQVVQTMASLLLPTLNADIIDNGVAVGDTRYILRAGGWMLLVTLIQVAASIAVVLFSARTAFSLGRDLRRAVYRRVGGFSRQEIVRLSVSSLITRTTNDVQQIQTLVLMSCSFLVMAPILVVGGVAMAMIQDLSLSWLIAISAPLLLVALLLIMLRLAPLYRLMQRRLDAVNRVLREQLSGIRVVRAFVRERDEQARFERANRDITHTALQVGRWNALTAPVIMAVLNFSSVAVLWSGALRVEDGTLQVGTLIAFLQYLMQILMAVMMATFMIMMIPRAAVSAERVGEVLATHTTVVAPPLPVSMDRRDGRITFESVTFQYPGAEEPVLREISFTVQPGTTTAIVGSTGSGKTTLISIVPRLLDVTHGRVLIDGVNARDLALKELRSRIALVPQRPYLFAGTVASNLRFSDPHATDEELWHVLAVAQARDFVAALPGALNAPITQGGTNVSGGQRQRLSIARALLRRADVLVFDDSFSALDTETDARLRSALSSSFSTTTQLIVAQRIASIVDADQIVVLEHGEIVATGTHTQLLKSSATYAQIASSQTPIEEHA